MIDFLGFQFNITNPPLNPISEQELSLVENELGFLFPDDYRIFITTLGAGELNICLRVFPPKYILNNLLHQTRERLSEYWFWDKDPAILTQSHAVECVPFFDSPAGDDILFHPSDRNRWFILQHEHDKAVVVHSFGELCNRYSSECNNDKDSLQFEFSRYLDI
jgi:hypothetical protein